MEINSLRVNCRRLQIVFFFFFFLWYRHGRRIFFFPLNVPFQTSVVFLTLHDTSLTTRGRQGIIVLFFVFFCDGLERC